MIPWTQAHEKEEDDMTMEKARESLNRIDDQLAALLYERMAVIDEIAQYKAQTGMPVYQPDREAAVISRLLEMHGRAYEQELRLLYQCIFDISRVRQRRLIDDKNAKT